MYHNGKLKGKLLVRFDRSYGAESEAKAELQTTINELNDQMDESLDKLLSSNENRLAEEKTSSLTQQREPATWLSFFQNIQGICLSRGEV